MASIIAKFRLEANSGTACIHGTFATLKRTFLLLLLILYALIGGAILSSLEFPNEKAMKEQRLELLRSEALNLSGQIFQIFNSNGNSWRESSNITTALLKRYQMSKHIIITDTTISDFQSSLFYSLTLITTIGNQ